MEKGADNNGSVYWNLISGSQNHQDLENHSNQGHGNRQHENHFHVSLADWPMILN